MASVGLPSDGATQPFEIVGMLLHRNVSEITLPTGPSFDRDLLVRLAQAHERNGYDRVLILQNAFAPDSFPLAMYAASVTRTLKFMIAHRPGFVAPTMAARMFATFDQICDGRVGVHIIAGANDAETHCDGDFLTKEDRYRRSREYVQILRMAWTRDKPFDFDGDFYRLRKALSEVRPVQSPCIPIFWGGASPPATSIAGEQADTYAIGGLDTLDRITAIIQTVQAAAAKAGRTIRFQTSARVILGETEEAAWRNADRVGEQLAEAADLQRRGRDGVEPSTGGALRTDTSLSTARGGSGRNRVEALALGRRVLDTRLWTGTSAASSEAVLPIPPALVGTAEQVAVALMAYYDLGVRGFLIRGFDLLGDPDLFGRTLFPLLRQAVAERQSVAVR